MKIDKFNHQILQELKIDGRIRNIDLADKVGLSPSACLRRVQELERQGIITGYKAIVDSRKLGKGFSAFEYILRVETTDLVSYKTFHTDVLGDLPQVATISTHVVMESTKDERK